MSELREQGIAVDALPMCQGQGSGELSFSVSIELAHVTNL